MKLSKEMVLKITPVQEIIIAHTCYASAKLWNMATHERKNYLDYGWLKPISYYHQCLSLKESLWFRSLNAQCAQSVLRLLDQNWRSFYTLKRNHPELNPKPPRYKKGSFITIYIQNGIKRIDNETVRLSISKGLKKYLSERFDLHEDFLFLKHPFFKNVERIKQIILYPPKDGTVRIRTIYEIEDIPLRPFNGRDLSIDMGIHNLMTCYNCAEDESFIVGRKYLSIERLFHKKIAHYSSINDSQASKKGMECSKMSKRVKKLWNKKRNAINDYLHKITRAVANYCLEHNITRVIIGKLTGVRRNKRFGVVTNQKIHELPFRKIVKLLRYKLRLFGIILEEQDESWTSQTPPDQPICKTNAQKKNRIRRGLYKYGDKTFNSDALGAYNIWRKKTKKEASYLSITSPFLLKVAV